MDTKEKRPAPSKAPTRRPPQGSAGQAVHRPSAPQGANIYGAGRGTGNVRTTAKPRQPEVKKPQKKNFFKEFMSKGAEVSRNAGASRDRVVQAQRKMQAKRRHKRERAKDTPAVIYTDPKPFNRAKLFKHLLLVAAVVVAFVLGLSVFFKVENVTISGAETYSPWAVREASGIVEGEGLLTFSRARASAQIRAKLSYVDKVRIGIKLPDTVIIYIEEIDVAYAIQDQDGIWWLMTSEGRIVEQSDSASAQNYTKILGVALQSPKVNDYAVAIEEVPIQTGEEADATDATEGTLPVIVTGAQRLSTALQILQALEANDIVGEAASVDVSSVNSIELWYGKRYQVDLGDPSRMEYKIACMNSAILQLSDYQTGKLDISFTTWADQVGYTPFA